MARSVAHARARAHSVAAHAPTSSCAYRSNILSEVAQTGRTFSSILSGAASACLRVNDSANASANASASID
eukprot:3298563-Pleurochrysis_carterae.AAC.2